ncbi:MAG: cobalt-precorrin-5B (C(1))-methyltransferase CbiD [Eubacteriales bacterium]|nr:cobalt-precorrin-5B (C(1))-methyltransferase CbiD [Eubacteriales bacterium]
MEQYIYKNHKKLRYGYTTGSCAAGAAKAAAAMLLSGKEVSDVELMTPKGIRLRLEVLDIRREPEAVSCAIRKDGGDDPDVTNGILVYARVSRRSDGEASRPAGGSESALPSGSDAVAPPAGSAASALPDEDRIRIDGGAGVGRVTKPGLEQPVGAAAINSIPRRMIRENLLELCERYGYGGGLDVVISIPEGEALAAKTFNPRLGIVGGISVLGTSGIVEPMSEQALIDTIRVEMRQKLAGGMEYLLVVPGNYGIDFLGRYGHGLKLEDAVKCSNFVGEALDAAVEFGAKGVLLIGHIGKFVKLAGGIMNTHSHNADARMELLTVHAALLGAPVETLRRMMECVTTDDALKYLEESGLTGPVMERLMERMEFYVSQRVQNRLELGVVTFSNVYGVLGQTARVPDLVEKIGRQSL